MDPLKMYFLLNMGIFHFYVGLPEGTHLLRGVFKHMLFWPLPGEMIQFDEHIFQGGWNHQLAIYFWPLIGALTYFTPYKTGDGVEQLFSVGAAIQCRLGNRDGCSIEGCGIVTNLHFEMVKNCWKWGSSTDSWVNLMEMIHKIS